MILALDIGNSRIKAGISLNETVSCFAADTRPLRNAADYLNDFNIPGPVEGVVLSSVVEELTERFREFSISQWGCEPVVVDHLLDTGLSYAVRNPEKIGPDRIANAAGSYYSGNGPSIVVDLGTATTITVVGRGASFLGGSILPGALMMAESLAEKTSKLPCVDLVLPRSVIGKDTQENIQSGIFFGIAGAVERAVEEIRKDIKYPMKVLLTGGLCEVFRGLIRNADVIDPLLTMKGLFLIHQRIQSRTSRAAIDSP